RIFWERRGSYSVYPEEHIGRNCGSAAVKREEYRELPEEYGKKPVWNWKEDSRDDFLYAENDLRQLAATRDFNTKRPHIVRYGIRDVSGTELVLRPIFGDLAAYVQKMEFHDCMGQPDQTDGDHKDRLQITLGAYDKSMEWGNYCGRKPTLQEKRHFAFEICISQRNVIE
ncbi:MAG: hypothetical protein PUJ62_02995, partial [Lachnospiraceae bacterium]|nr:hypothetical protein [Lachnospiraceae bacterium]